MSPKSVEAAASILTNMTTAFVAAINARDFDSEIWESVVPSFRTSPARLTGAAYALTGKQQFIASMRELARDCPTWRIDLHEITTHISEELDFAVVFAHSSSSGEPDGIARPVLTRMEYRFTRGRWMFVSHEIIPGIDISGDG